MNGRRRKPTLTYRQPSCAGIPVRKGGEDVKLEALRKVNRYGVSQSGQQYRGWRAIESGSSVPAGMGPLAAAAFIWTTAGNANDDPHDTPLDRMRANNEVARNVYRAARKNSHPDRNGGDSGTFLRVETAAKVLRANGVNI